MKQILSNGEAKKMLNSFADAVKKKQYTKRIPYEHWKKIASANKVTIESVKDAIKVIANAEFVGAYAIDDNGFGAYLSNTYNNLDGGDSMTLNEAFKGISGCAATATNSLNVCADAITATYAISSDCNTYSKIAIQSDVDSLREQIETVCKTLNETKVIKENDNMGFNFDFGPCTKDDIRLSMYGLAVKNNAGTWVSYNAEADQIVDVDILNFDGRKYMFKMPVAINEIAVGDIIVHNRVPMFVVGKDNGIVAIDVRAGEEKKIIPTTNMFGFNFVTKIISMFDAVAGAPTADKPFGNFLPFLMMNENDSLDPMMVMMMLNGGQLDMSNPMLMYMMFAKDKNIDPMMLMFMSGGFKPSTNK